MGALMLLAAGFCCFCTSVVYSRYVRSHTGFACNQLQQTNKLTDAFLNNNEVSEDLRLEIAVCKKQLSQIPKQEVFTFGPAVYCLYIAGGTAVLSFIMIWMGSYNTLPWVSYENNNPNQYQDNFDVYRL